MSNVILPKNTPQVSTGLQSGGVSGQDGGVQLGGQPVRQGVGNSIRKFFSDAFTGIRDAFVGLKDRITTHFAEKRTAERTKALDKAVDNFIARFSDGPFTGDVGKGERLDEAQKVLTKLMAAATKLDKHDPQGRATTAIMEKFRSLPPDQQALISAQSGALLRCKTDVLPSITENINRTHTLVDAMAKQGMAPPLTEQQKAKDHAFVTHLSGTLDTLLQKLGEGFTKPVIDPTQGLDSNGKIQVLLPKLPQGLQIAPNGTVSGSCQLTTTPQVSTTLLPQQRGVTLDVAMTHMAQIGLNGELKEYGTQKITSQATKDLYRFDFDIPTSTGGYQSKNDPEEEVTQRTTNCVNSLRDFTGNDKATTVLSSTLTQSVLRSIHDSMKQPGGGEALMRFAANQTATLKGPDGQLIDLGNIKNYGSAKFTLSTDQNGDFKVKIDWPMYFDALDRGAGSTKQLPIHEGGMLKANFEVEFVVNKQQAEQGILSMSLPQTPTVTFSGSLTL